MIVTGRHHARMIALQALYELDLTEHAAEYALGCRIKEHPLPQAGVAFAFHLVEGVIDHATQVDTLLTELAPEWPVEQIAVIDRNVLRLAIFELCFDAGDTPPKVVINEAVELAKMFGADSAPRFVNGVLGSLVNRKREHLVPSPARQKSA